MGRIAAAVWAAIALCGAIATIGPLEIPGSDTTQMREIAALAAFFAGVSFLLPWSRLPQVAFGIGLVLMSALIAGLAHASGSADSGLTILFTFVVALGASFMPVRSSVAQLAVIAVLLVALVLVVGQADAMHLAVFKVTLLLATLIVLCGLVLIMRATLDQRALGMRGHGSRRYGSVILDTPEFDAALDTELSRAGRHERPLAVVALEVVGSVADAQGRRHRDAVAAVARTIVERIRIEDAVGHPGGLRFTLVAPETTSAGVAAMASTLAAVVRRRLVVAGFEPDQFEVAVGWAEFPHRATTREDLMLAALEALEVSKRGAAQHHAASGGLGTEPATGSA
ncbi:MAG: GGDEF domain-containing protein [Solirubrobacterales bacterium]